MYGVGNSLCAPYEAIVSEGPGPLFNDNTEPRASHRTGFPFQGDSQAHRLGTDQQALVHRAAPATHCGESRVAQWPQ